MADFQVKGILTLETGAFVGQATAASNSLNGLNKSATNASTSMKYLKRGAMAAGLALAGLGAAGMKAASDYQQAEIAFTTMLGSAEKATAFLKDMRQFAAETPFELPDLLTGSRRLLAMGFQLEDLKPMLTAVGDAASGLGVGADGIQRITLALGQMKAKGRVSSQELNQLSETGVPALRYLAEAAGVTTAQMQKMVESGAVPADEAIRVLTEGMENGIGTVAGFGGMMDKQSKTMSGLMSTLKDTVRNAFVDGVQKYIPGISTAFSTMITKVGPMIQTFINAMGFIVDKVGQVAGGIATLLKPVFQNFLIPAFKVLVVVIAAALTALGAIGNAIKSAAGFFQTLITVIGLAAATYGTYIAVSYAVVAVEKLKIAWQKLSVMWTNRATIATTAYAAAQRILNAAIAFNPIALIVAGLTALVAGFALAWNHSETFRKVIIALGKAGIIGFGYIIGAVGKLVKAIIMLNTGPLRLFLKALSFLPGAAGKAAKGALGGLEGMTDKVGNFFDESALKAQDWAKSLDTLGNKKIPLPKIGGGSTKDKVSDPTAATDFAGALGGAKGKGKKAIVKDVAGVLQAYNDYIVGDFSKGFTDGSDKARDTILTGLDKLKTVFDEQAKGLKGTALKNLKSSYDKVNEVVRGFIPQAQANAAALEQVSEMLLQAEKAYEDVLKARAEGAAMFAEVMKKPFGEPSELTKALSGAEATIDSIIGMYDKMVSAINKRFEGLDSAKKNELINYLTDETAKLVQLAKRRDEAAKALADSQKYLQDVLDTQSNFRSTVTGSLRDFGLAMADLSKGDAEATVSVIKTASGYMISQMTKSSSGLDKITNQLKDRLASIKSFAENLKTLLAKGVNKTYIQQLLSAGPEAAGSTAALLATAGSDQLTVINDLYSEIGTVSDTFGKDMADVFYGNSVAMAQAMVAGAQTEYDSIVAEMTRIKNGIETTLGPLADLGTNLGKDLAKGLIDALTAKKAELVAIADSIATAIKAAMDAALAEINVDNGAGALTKPKTNNGLFVGPIPVGTVRTETGYKPTTAPVLDRDNKFYNYDPTSGTVLNGDINLSITTKGAFDPAIVVDTINTALLGRR